MFSTTHITIDSKPTDPRFTQASFSHGEHHSYYHLNHHFSSSCLVISAAPSSNWSTMRQDSFDTDQEKGSVTSIGWWQSHRTRGPVSGINLLLNN